MRTSASRSIIRIGALIAALALQHLGGFRAAEIGKPSPEEFAPEMVRVSAVQAKRRMIDWRIGDRAELLAAVDDNLSQITFDNVVSHQRNLAITPMRHGID